MEGGWICPESAPGRFFPPHVGKFHFLPAPHRFFPDFSQCGLFNSCKRACALLQLGHVFLYSTSRDTRTKCARETKLFFEIFLRLKLSEWSTSFLLNRMQEWQTIRNLLINASLQPKLNIRVVVATGKI